MTDYGKAIVEAAAKAALDSEAERAARATLLAAIDKLIARGASDRMVHAALMADDQTPRGEFDAMLRVLRAEIEEAR